ncbi:MAG: type II toxin-antitoxin system VapC family toxin [Chloroflexi bacterium]|nr:type II toxin-antitoxin system VapC family toxin [Chloroflexota bacterium]
MADVWNYVVDASIGAKWFLRDEKYTPESLTVLDDFQRGRTRLFAPDLIRHEITSALSKATRRMDRPHRPTLAEGWQATETFLSLGVTLIPDEPLRRQAYLLASQYGCSYYDALYLALAQALNCQTIYADDKLRRTLRNSVPLALWIEDYRTH